MSSSRAPDRWEPISVWGHVWREVVAVLLGLTLYGLMLDPLLANPVAGWVRTVDVCLGVVALALLRLHVALAKYPVDEVVEARVALERSSLALAAQRLDEESRLRLRGLLDRMAEPDTTQDEFNALDTDFHVVLAEVGRNRLMTDMTVAVRESLRRPILDAERSLGDWDGFRGELQEHHEAIYAAVVDGDQRRAADLVEAHIRAAYAILPIVLDGAPGSTPPAIGHQ